MDEKNLDYSGGYYKKVSINRKRQIINGFVDDLTNMQLDMIDQAVEYSDLRDAMEIIKYIQSK